MQKLCNKLQYDYFSNSIHELWSYICLNIKSEAKKKLLRLNQRRIQGGGYGDLAPPLGLVKSMVFRWLLGPGVCWAPQNNLHRASRFTEWPPSQSKLSPCLRASTTLTPRPAFLSPITNIWLLHSTKVFIFENSQHDQKVFNTT